MALLERCLRRLEFEKKKEAEDKAAAEQIEAERAAMQAVDWCAILPWKSIMPISCICQHTGSAQGYCKAVHFSCPNERHVCHEKAYVLLRSVVAGLLRVGCS